MAERPIIFSAPMVRAIIAGRKTQTRRVLKSGKLAEDIASETAEDLELRGWETFRRHDDALCAAKLPCAAGDLLWVRESCADEHPLAIQAGRYSQPGLAGIPGPPRVEFRTIYRADGEPLHIWRNASGEYPYFTLDGPADEVAAKYPSNYTRADGRGVHWTPSIHMPRWASRITLKVTGVKVERLRDISEADAKAEGIYWSERFEGWTSGAGADESCDFHTRLPERSFEKLWERIHGDGSWDANPWVAAISFDRVPSSRVGATPPDGDGG